jgi:hypothetical protein
MKALPTGVRNRYAYLKYDNVRRRKNQLDAVKLKFIDVSHSMCFRHHYAHHQENSKGRKTAYGVLHWSCRVDLRRWGGSRVHLTTMVIWNTIIILCICSLLRPEHSHTNATKSTTQCAGYAVSETRVHTFDVTFGEQNVITRVCSGKHRVWRSAEGQPAVTVTHHGIQNYLKLTVCSQLDQLLGSGNYAQQLRETPKSFILPIEPSYWWRWR